MSDDQRLEVAGYWWTSHNPNNRVPGVLRYLGDGKQELTTIGALRQRDEDHEDLGPSTILGDCHGTPFTLPESYFNSESRHVRTGEELLQVYTTETWTAFTVVRGVHLRSDSRFHIASFGLSGLSSLWYGWGLSQSFDEDLYEVRSEIERPNGDRVKLVRLRQQSFGVDHRSYQDHIRFRIEADDGLTLEDLDKRYIQPTKAFVASVTGEPSDSIQVQLGDFVGSALSGADERMIATVDPWNQGTEAHYAGLLPLIHSADPFFVSVLSSWLSLSEKLISPMVISAPRRKRGFLETETFFAAGAMEQLQRELVADLPTPFADSVKRRLADATTIGISKSERRRIYSTMKLSEVSLRQRLELLVTSKGEAFFRKLLQGHISEWAEATARVRNILGHGLAYPNGSATDYGLFLDVDLAARHVVIFRLLIECGYPEEVLLSKASEKLNWSHLLERAHQWPKHALSVGSRTV